MFWTSSVLSAPAIIWGAAAIWTTGTLALLISSFLPPRAKTSSRVHVRDGPFLRLSSPYRTALGTAPRTSAGLAGPPSSSSYPSGLRRPQNRPGPVGQAGSSPRFLRRGSTRQKGSWPYGHASQAPHIKPQSLHWLPFGSRRQW